MRLIDADLLKSEWGELKKLDQRYRVEDFADSVDGQPTAYDVDAVVEKLKESTDFLSDCTKYGNKDAEQQGKSYSTMMMYEIKDLVDDLIEIVNAQPYCCPKNNSTKVNNEVGI